MQPRKYIFVLLNYFPLHVLIILYCFVSYRNNTQALFTQRLHYSSCIAPCATIVCFSSINVSKWRWHVSVHFQRVFQVRC